MNRHHNQGFALLITLVVVSIILAIGLSLLFVTTKQYLLAVTATQSELAFQAAQVGLECMRWHRAQPATLNKLLRDDLVSWPPSLNCAGVTPNTPPGIDADTIYTNDTLRQYLYKYEYFYTVGGNQCINTSIYVSNLRSSTTTGFTRPIPSSEDEGLSEITCAAGSVCTTIFSRGYNRPCNQLNSIFTIQREITIDY